MQYSNAPYQPIACEDHDRLEELATTRRSTTIVYEEASGVGKDVVAVIVDVHAQAGAEYMVLANGLRIRLDAIRLVDGNPVGSASTCGLSS